MSRARYQLLSSNDQAASALDVETGGGVVSGDEETTTTRRETSTSTSTTMNSQQTQTPAQPAATAIASEQLHEIRLDQETTSSNNSTSIQMNAQSNVPTTTVAGATAGPSLAELPSYNEAVRLKKLEANSNDLPPAYFPPNTESRFPIDPSDILVDETNSFDQDIGSECMFLSAFMIAFFFNWIGFFASICLLPNAAGKYGALSGFGLSMAKWVTIVRYQEWMVNMNDFQQKLFFWLFIFLGFYLFFRGLINYMTLKYRPIATLEYTRQQSRNRWLTFLD